MSDLLAVMRKANDQESKQYLEIVFLVIGDSVSLPNFIPFPFMAAYLNFLQDEGMNLKNI